MASRMIFVGMAALALSMSLASVAEARWQCNAQGNNGATGWGRSDREDEAKGIALGECNARASRCWITSCTLLSSDQGSGDSRHVCHAVSSNGGSATGRSPDLAEAKGLALGRCLGDFGGRCTITSCD